MSFIFVTKIVNIFELQKYSLLCKKEKYKLLYVNKLLIFDCVKFT